jgi:tRNA(Ile)-lysidine synthase
LLVLRELGYFVGVAHLNHGLRGEAAAEDARFVAALAERLQVPYFSREIELSGHAGNIEAAGRAARMEFFRTAMSDAGFSRLALAHHRQDRVETFLFHLVRGSGTEGLVSLAPVSGSTVRPLADVERSEIEDYLVSRGQPWQTDHTNFDVDLSRNRMRHRVIPELAASFNPRVVEAVARTADLLRDEDQWKR